MKIGASELTDSVNVYWVPIMCPISLETLEGLEMPGQHYCILSWQ